MQAETLAETTLRPLHSPQPAADDDILLTSIQVRARVGGVSSMAIWRWQRDERVKFPAPDLVLNKRNYWYLKTLRQWQAAQTSKAA